MNFKPGDVVVCVDASASAVLTPGHRYTISSCPDEYRVTLVEFPRSLYADRPARFYAGRFTSAASVVSRYED